MLDAKSMISYRGGAHLSRRRGHGGILMKTAVEEEECTNAMLLHTHSAFLRQSSLDELEEYREAAHFRIKNNESRGTVNWILTLIIFTSPM